MNEYMSEMKQPSNKHRFQPVVRKKKSSTRGGDFGRPAWLPEEG